MDYEARRKERTVSAGLIQEHTQNWRQKRGKWSRPSRGKVVVERWHGGNNGQTRREKTHQARCPNNEGMARRFKQGRRLRGRGRGRRLGHPTMQGRGKPAECNRSLCHTTFRPPLLKIFILFLIFVLRKPTEYLKTNVSPSWVETLRRSANKREDRACRRLPASKHRTASRYSCMREHHECHPRSSLGFKSPDTTDAHSRLTHPPAPSNMQRTFEKEGVPIVRISSLIYLPPHFILTMVTPEDIAEEIRTSFPGTEEIVVQYLAGYLWTTLARMKTSSKLPGSFSSLLLAVTQRHFGSPHDKTRRYARGPPDCPSIPNKPWYRSYQARQSYGDRQDRCHVRYHRHEPRCRS
jgi:hypothetical protein